MRQILRSASNIAKCDWSLLQSVSDITKFDKFSLHSAYCMVLHVTDHYCKVRQVLQSVTVITKWDLKPMKLRKVDKTLERLSNKSLNKKIEMSLVSLILKA